MLDGQIAELCKQNNEFGRNSKRVTARIIAFPIPDIYYRAYQNKTTHFMVFWNLFTDKGTMDKFLGFTN